MPQLDSLFRVSPGSDQGMRGVAVCEFDGKEKARKDALMRDVEKDE